MAERETASHLLAPDLTAIDAMAAEPNQPHAQTGRAARALYDDVVRRLALAELPPEARARVRGIEARAADLLEDFLRRGLPPRYFWADFASLAHELDAIVSAPTATHAASVGVRQALAALRRQVAVAAVPPAWRASVQGNLTALATALRAFDLGEIAEDELIERLELAREAVQQAIGQTRRFGPEVDEERLHRLTRRALDDGLTPLRREAIASHLRPLLAAWHGGEPPAAASLDALEQMLTLDAEPAHAPLFAAGGAAIQLDQAESRLTAAPLPPFVASAALGILADLRAAVADDPATPIAAGLEALEVCMAFAREVDAESTIAARRLETAARRVEDAVLPPLLAGQAEDQLERLRVLLDSLDAGRVPLLEFHRALDAGLDTIDRLLAWRDVLA